MGSLRGADPTVAGGVEPPPARKLAEVADIAETIINYLLPDDEDDCRDTFENDYQLDSDVETFENLTGKTIRPIISS
jgi:hypothetical protein